MLHRSKMGKIVNGSAYLGSWQLTDVLSSFWFVGAQATREEKEMEEEGEEEPLH